MNEEQQYHDPAGSEVDHDQVESNAIPQGQGAKGATRLDPGAKRVIKWVAIAFGAAAVVVIGLVFAASSKKEMRASVNLPTNAGSGQQTDVVQTDYEKGRLAELQRQKAEESKAQGGVYVPPPAGAPVTQDKLAGLNGPTGPGPGSYNTYVAPAQVVIQPGSLQDPARQQAIQEGLNRQLGQLLAEQPTGSPIARVQMIENKQAAAAQAAGQGAGTQASGSSAAVEDPDLPGPLTIHAARTTSPIDTSRSSYVSAEVVGGKYAGAFLKGTAVLNQGEGLQITFTDIRINGKVSKINAVALDEQTSADALAGNIDRHILTKYVLPVAFASFSGAASAIAQRSSQVVTNGLTSSVVVPEATSRQAAAAGIASGTQIGQQIVQSLQQQPNTATLPSGTLIGVLFNTVQAASSTAAPAQQQQQQQQQQRNPQPVTYVQPQATPQYNLATGMNYGTFVAPVVPYNNQTQVRY